MDLTIVIVNYNVKHFLEQCLYSVIKASHKLNTEIIVIDNNSADGSCSMMLEKFSQIKLIRNTENLGFSKANNQALKIARGKYILLLNPDTIIHEDSLNTCNKFMEENKQAGAIGLKMIDGKGIFLPESKRSLPTPRSSFYKIFGLASLFPGSNKFNSYYLKHLDNNQIHKVDILTGAFMFLRSSALDKTGYLDEDFFMYAEDIDLCYRLVQNGYSNYYLPSPAIIHFKGESTKKSEFNYPRYFYGSMILFVKKYYVGKKAVFLSLLLKAAIILRAIISFLKLTATKLALPLADSIALFLVYFGSIEIWETIKYNQSYNYPGLFKELFLISAILIVVISLIAGGGYKRFSSLKNIFTSSIIGSVLIMLVYAILPSELRFSRAIILIWSFLTPPVIFALRLLLSPYRSKIFPGTRKRRHRIIIISGSDEFKKIEDIVRINRPDAIIAGRISVSDKTELNSLGNISQIEEIVRINNPNELIFSSKDLSAGIIISLISLPKLERIEKKIARTDSDFVIGSNNSSREGEVYSVSALGKSISR